MIPFYEKDGIVIYCGDNASVMAGLQPNIDLTVTSPPYDNLRDYNGYDWDFDKVSSELFRLTVKGGVVVWVVGDATINGSETGTSFRQALGFMDRGFKLHDTMIWEKVTPIPQIYRKRYTNAVEYMFVFSNEFVETHNPILVDCKYTGMKLSKSNYKNYSKGSQKRTTGKTTGMVSKKKQKTNIWKYQYSSKDRKCNKNHPAIFPEALARDHIISWSNPNDLILDPFLGSGTTLKMSQQLGRQAIGIELSEEYCQIAVERLRQPTFFSLPPSEPSPKPEQGKLL